MDNASKILSKLETAFQANGSINSGDLIATKNALSELSNNVDITNTSKAERTSYFTVSFSLEPINVF